jgi:hypothetical protein
MSDFCIILRNLTFCFLIIKKITKGKKEEKEGNVACALLTYTV